ncbi:ENTH domain protein [Aspergillus homomorphus CBS 101889]|uniref:Epsin N-terminal homology family protein n=1 Tax=Aspergillus homomorphus (strain CBS 101889) TaxID=1450537 RepID=A0A395HU59_ASPHC|nr:epsin N-terminal homology family protein [Aspergillus homomorphus CBS 101889]RAL11330.1 epsin N-terminal homology family protein [Aspergillus homomorphus CBS 101889]
MSHNFEKSVKGATKVKLAAPKSKYIEHILVATHTGEAGVAEIFRTLQLRLRDSTWTIVFKALIVIHLMIREGQLDATLQYMAENPQKLAISGFSEVQSQGHNIRRYSDYLLARAKAFETTKTDYVRSGQGRMRRLTVEKGLLRETEIVQRQIRALLRCDLLTDDVENEISLTAFRLLTLDLLTLYSVMNEGTINVLEHYFEMSRPDSERALEIYKTFTQQTEEVVKFLGVARHFQSATRLEIPKLKHASTDLTRLLEDDLNDPDFNLRRREYLARKQGKSVPAPSSVPKNSTGDPSANHSNFNQARPQTQLNPQAQAKSNPVDLIDFFDSIEQNQQPMAQQNTFQQQQFQQQPQTMQFQQAGFQPQQQAFYAQQTGFPQQQLQQQPQAAGYGQQPAPFGPQFTAQNPQQFNQPHVPQPLQPDHTGAGFGGYSAQPQNYGYQLNLAPIPQNDVSAFPPQQQQQPQPQQQLVPGGQQLLQPQSTNPFRQSMLMNTPTGSVTPLDRQNTNPFARRLSTAHPQYNAGGPEAFPPAQAQPQSQVQQPAPLQAQRTGTNPFARSSSVPPQQTQGLQPPAAAPLRPNPTGSTNPFRQSAFVNQQTGQGWHVGGQQGTMGGLEQLDTVPIFPRPGM